MRNAPSTLALLVFVTASFLPGLPPRGAAASGESPARQGEVEPEPIPSALGEAYRLGDGDPTLLLIPCASCRWRSFDGFMARNADRYTMVAVTLPGYGGTTDPGLPRYADGHVWHDHAVEALAQLLEGQGLGDVVVIGHSFGSLIGLELAHRRPDLVGGLVNLDGWPTNGPEVADQDPHERLRQARSQMDQYVEPLRDPDAWQQFNMPAPYFPPERRVLYHGWFMATEREVMAQYWWDNLLADRNPWFRALPMPYLDIKTIPPQAQDPQGRRRNYEDHVAEIGAPGRYQLIFLYDTYHYVMEHRPELLDELIARFVAGEPLEDVHPETPPR